MRFIKLIKSEPGLVNNDDEKHLMTLMAMRITSDEVWARCNNETKRTKIVLSQELEK